MSIDSKGDDEISEHDLLSDPEDSIPEHLEIHLSNAIVNLAQNMRLQKLAAQSDPKKQKAVKVMIAYLRTSSEHPEQQKGRQFKMAA